MPRPPRHADRQASSRSAKADVAPVVVIGCCGRNRDSDWCSRATRVRSARNCRSPAEQVPRRRYRTSADLGRSSPGTRSGRMRLRILTMPEPLHCLRCRPARLARPPGNAPRQRARPQEQRDKTAWKPLVSSRQPITVALGTERKAQGSHSVTGKFGRRPHLGERANSRPSSARR